MGVIAVNDYRFYEAEKGNLRGIFVFGCVERGHGSSFRSRGHAHTSKHDPNFGWICVRSPKRLGKPHKPSMLMIHELAHIITLQGHTDKWRAKVRELGGKIGKRYQKRRREQ